MKQMIDKNKPRITVWSALMILTPLLVSSPFMAGAEERGQGYVIGPEDVLEIAVWKDSELTKMVVVRPDGRISFPLIGEIQAGGQTVERLQNEIKSRLEGYMSESVVSVSVNQINSMRIYVIGTVLRPGEFRIGRNINVLQALSLAGGLAPFADADSIAILRTENNAQTKIGFKYEEVARGKNLEQNIFLKTGDVVVVP